MEVIFFTNAFFFKRTQQLGSHFSYIYCTYSFWEKRRRWPHVACGHGLAPGPPVNRNASSQGCQLGSVIGPALNPTSASWSDTPVRLLIEWLNLLSKWRGNAELISWWINEGGMQNPALPQAQDLCSSPGRINQRRKANQENPLCQDQSTGHRGW